MNALAKSSLLALLLPAILPLAWPPQGEPVRQSFPEFAGTLRGRVVDEEVLPIRQGLLGDAAQAGSEDVGRWVVDGRDDGDMGHG